MRRVEDSICASSLDKRPSAREDIKSGAAFRWNPILVEWDWMDWMTRMSQPCSSGRVEGMPRDWIGRECSVEET